MITNYLNTKKRQKFDTDKYESDWHYSNSHDVNILSVWESPTSVGPEAYNSGHIDNILYNNPRNDVRTIINGDDGIYVCRRGLNKWRVKFVP